MGAALLLLRDCSFFWRTLYKTEKYFNIQTINTSQAHFKLKMKQEKEHACPSVDDDEQGALEGLLELNTDRDNVSNLSAFFSG